MYVILTLALDNEFCMTVIGTLKHDCGCSHD